MPYDAEAWEKLWEDYEKNMNKEAGDHLVKDGACEEWWGEYEGQKPKVLFILKEGNESGGDGQRVQSIFEKGDEESGKLGGWFERYTHGGKNSLGKNDAKLITKMLCVYLVLKDVWNGSAISVDELEKKMRKREPKPADIKEIAFINLNKHGNGKRESDGKYVKHMNNDAALLCRQIKLLSPDVIVLGLGAKGAKVALEKFMGNIFNKLSIPAERLIVTKHFSVASYASFASQIPNTLPR